MIAVTGTNGKSTTTALIAHLLSSAGIKPAFGGNIGTPVFDLELKEQQPVVLELSSFQLDLCTDLAPDVAIWLNLTPDHLDRHGDLDGYIRAKRRIFDGQTQKDLAIIGIDDEPGRQSGSQAATITVGQDPAASIRIQSDGFTTSDGEFISLKAAPSLQGLHNVQNAACAFAAVQHVADRELAIWQGGFESFRGLAHRMEPCAQCANVRFINDSKATNPDSAARSLESFANIHWIAGGKPKPGGFRSLRNSMKGVDRIYTIGEAAAEIGRDLGDLAETFHAGTLELAVGQAFEAARHKDAVVLLAPACASFDQFESFEARGDRFRQLAREACAREIAA